MILAIGFANESTLSHFLEHAAKREVEVDLLDLGRIEMCDRLEIEAKGSALRIRFDRDWMDLSEYDAIYTRAFYLDSAFPRRGESARQLLAYVNAFLTCADALVVNRPSAGHSNSNKLLHVAELGRFGFIVPHALGSSSPEDVSKALAGEQRWISKSCSSAKTQAVDVDGELLANADRLRWCPSQFQHRITGYDVRVHVVGSQVIGLKICSSILDYRFERLADSPNEFIPCEVPGDIAKLCYRYARSEDLHFAGFDFKVDADERWHVLEANPMPGYEYFDRRLDSTISGALLDLLLTGANEPRGVAPEPRAPFVESDRRPLIRLA